MFCQKCGTQIGEGAEFCHKCGTKVVYKDSVQSIESNHIAAEREKMNVVIQDDVESLRRFMDDYIRSTTKFQSAEALLKRSNPQLLIWIICFIIFSILGVGGAGPIGLLLGIFFAQVSRWISGVIIRTKCFTKTTGQFDKNINMDQLCHFLNEKLNSLYPCFHQWSLAGNRMITSFGEKKMMERCVVSLYITEPEYLQPRDSSLGITRKNYVIDVEDKGTILSKIIGQTLFAILQISDPRTVCLIRTAPILQAAMLYYLKNY